MKILWSALLHRATIINGQIFAKVLNSASRYRHRHVIPWARNEVNPTRRKYMSLRRLCKRLMPCGILQLPWYELVLCKHYNGCVKLQINWLIKSRWLELGGADPVSTGMGDRLWAGIPSRYVTIQLSTQSCIPPGSLNRVTASAGVKAGMTALPGGR